MISYGNSLRCNNRKIKIRCGNSFGWNNKKSKSDGEIHLIEMIKRYDQIWKFIALE